MSLLTLWYYLHVAKAHGLCTDYHADSSRSGHIRAWDSCRGTGELGLQAQGCSLGSP